MKQTRTLTSNNKGGRVRSALTIMAATGGILGLVGGTFGITYSLMNKENTNGTNISVNGEKTLSLGLGYAVSWQYSCSSNNGTATDDATFSINGELPRGLLFDDKGLLSGKYSGDAYACGSFQVISRLNNMVSNPFNVSWNVDDKDGPIIVLGNSDLKITNSEQMSISYTCHYSNGRPISDARFYINGGSLPSGFLFNDDTANSSVLSGAYDFNNPTKSGSFSIICSANGKVSTPFSVQWQVENTTVGIIFANYDTGMAVGDSQNIVATATDSSSVQLTAQGPGLGTNWDFTPTSGLLEYTTGFNIDQEIFIKATTTSGAERVISIMLRKIDTLIIGAQNVTDYFELTTYNPTNGLNTLDTIAHPKANFIKYVANNPDVNRIIFRDLNVGWYAFKDCSAMNRANSQIVSISFNNSVPTFIGNYAFENCASLGSISMIGSNKEIYINDYAFNNCQNLTGFDTPNTLIREIHYQSFAVCPSLTQVGIATNVGSVHDEMGMSCNLITGIGNDNVWFGVWQTPQMSMDSGRGVQMTNTAAGCLAKGSMPASVGIKTYEGCASVTAVDLGSDTYIWTRAFNSCLKLISVTTSGVLEGINNVYTAFGQDAFGGCRSFHDLYCGNTSTTLQYFWPNGGAGFNAAAYKGIVHAGNASASAAVATSINSENYRSNWTSDSSVPGPSVNNGVLEINDTNSTRYCVVSSNKITGITGLLSYDMIKYGVTKLIIKNLSVGESVFKSCLGLTIGNPVSLEIDNTANTEIGSYAFSGCAAINSIALANNKNIELGNECFGSCRRLTGFSTSGTNVHITFGNGDSFAQHFAGCPSLSKIGIIDNISTVKLYDEYASTTFDLSKVTFTDSGNIVGGYWVLQNEPAEQCNLLLNMCGSLAYGQIGSQTDTNPAMGFAGCAAITSIDISGVNNPGGTMGIFFNGCWSLQTIRFGNYGWINSNDNMFAGCNSLTDMHFNVSSAFQGSVPQLHWSPWDGTIHVSGNQTVADAIANQFGCNWIGSST